MRSIRPRSECIADAGPGHLVLAGEVLFAEPRAGRQFVFDDTPAQRFEHGAAVASRLHYSACRFRRRHWFPPENRLGTVPYADNIVNNFGGKFLRFRATENRRPGRPGPAA
jgi:hypothetical protein